MKNWRQVRAAMDIDEVLVAAERQRIEDAQAAGVDLDAVQYFNGRPVYLDRSSMTIRTSMARLPTALSVAAKD